MMDEGVDFWSEFDKIDWPSITLMAGHPFFKFATPTIFPVCGGKWRVKWRKFCTEMDDAEFETEAQARAFAETVNKPPLTVYDYSGELADHDKFWREL